MQHDRRTLLALMAIAVISSAVVAETGGPVIVDFVAAGSDWGNIDDAVMGGVSQSSMTVIDGVGAFSGVVSFENNGGFASVRTRPQPHDLSMFSGLVLKVRGDGKRYGFRMRTEASFDGVSYQAELRPPAGEWTEIELSFADFVPIFRGRRVSKHPPLDPSKVMTFGLMISRQQGSFRLEIESIRGLETAP